LLLGTFTRGGTRAALVLEEEMPATVEARSGDCSPTHHLAVTLPSGHRSHRLEKLANRARPTRAARKPPGSRATVPPAGPSQLPPASSSGGRFAQAFRHPP